MRFLLTLFFALFCLPLSVGAQDALPSPTPLPQPESRVTLGVEAPGEIKIGRNVIFRVANSEQYTESELSSMQFFWDMGDGTKYTGGEVVHTYPKEGEYQVKLFVTNGLNAEEHVHTIFAYRDLYVVLLDTPMTASLNTLSKAARERGIYLSLISGDEEKQLLGKEERLMRQMQKRKDDLSQATLYFAGQDGRRALSALSAFKKENMDFDFSRKSIIITTNANLFIFNRIASRSLSSIASQQLILVNKDLVALLYDLVTVESEESFLTLVTSGTMPVRVVDKKTDALGPTNVISYFINESIARGIPGDLFLFILLLPLIATLLAFLKQVVGLDTLGMFMPSVLTLTFVVLGVKIALFILLFTLLLNMGVRVVLARFYLLYVPKMALVVSVAAIGMLALIFVSVYLGFPLGIDPSESSRAILSIFPVVIMAMLAEQMMNIQNTKGLRSALRIFFEMILSCVLVYSFVRLDLVRTFVFAFPEFILFLCLSIDILLGKFAGLRLMEYLRFKDLFLHETEE